MAARFEKSTLHLLPTGRVILEYQLPDQPISLLERGTLTLRMVLREDSAINRISELPLFPNLYHQGLVELTTMGSLAQMMLGRKIEGSL